MKKLLTAFLFVAFACSMFAGEQKAHALLAGKHDSKITRDEIRNNVTLLSTESDQTIASFVVSWKSADGTAYIETKISGDKLTDDLIKQMTSLPDGSKIFIEQVNVSSGEKIAGAYFILN